MHIFYKNFPSVAINQDSPFSSLESRTPAGKENSEGSAPVFSVRMMYRERLGIDGRVFFLQRPTVFDIDGLRTRMASLAWEKVSYKRDLQRFFFPQTRGRTRTTVSQDVQTRFPVQLAFAKFLSKIKGNF